MWGISRPCKVFDQNFYNILKCVTEAFEEAYLNKNLNNVVSDLQAVFQGIIIEGTREPVANDIMIKTMTGGEYARFKKNRYTSTDVFDCVRHYFFRHNLCNTIAVYRTNDDQDIEFQTSTALEIKAINNNEIIMVNSNICLDPDPDEENAKQLLRSSYPFISDELLSILTIFGGRLLISPTECQNSYQSLYGCRAVFPAGTISENALASMGALFAILLTSKSRLATLFNAMCGGDSPDTDTVIRYLNDLGCMTGGVADDIRLKTDSQICCHVDETFLTCLEILKDSNGNLIRKVTYMSVHVSITDEKHIYVSYYANEARSEEVLSKDFVEVFSSESYNRKAKYYMTDGLKIYKKILKKIEEKFGIKVYHAVCFVHLRRYFIKSLDAQGLLVTYNNCSDCKYEDFEDELRKALSKENRPISEAVYYVLICTFLIDAIISLDVDFTSVDIDTLRERREKYSIVLLDKLFEIIEKLKDLTHDVVVVKEVSGTIHYKSNKATPWSAAIVYALNNKDELYISLHNIYGNIHNNIAERLLKFIAIGRNNMLFVASEYGFKALANLLTVVITDLVNNVPVLEHLYWIIANIKFLAEVYRIETANERGTLAQLFKHYQKEKDENGNIVERFDKNNSHVVNKLDLKDLDGISYMKKLIEEFSRIASSCLGAVNQAFQKAIDIFCKIF